MNNASTPQKKQTNTSFKKWLPAFGFAIVIHVLLILLFIYANKTKQQPTNAQPDHTPAPSVITTELTPANNTSDTTIEIDSTKPQVNSVPAVLADAQKNDQETKKPTSTTENTANQDAELTQKKQPTHTLSVTETPLSKTTTETTKVEPANPTTTKEQIAQKPTNTTPEIHINTSDSQIIEDATKPTISQNKGNAILIEGIDTPSKETIHTVKDQLLDNNQQLNKLDEQNTQAKDTAAQLHEQTSERIDAIIKYNQQSIEQNNQQKKLAFEQDSALLPQTNE